REGLLRPGMNAEVAIEIARRENAITIPNAAVVGMRDVLAASRVLGLPDEEVQATMSSWRGRGSRTAQSDTAAQKSQPDSARAGSASAGSGASPECAALIEKARADRSSLTEEERAKLRECRPRRQGGRQGRQGARQGGRGSETRMGVVFVQGPEGPTPRRV